MKGETRWRIVTASIVVKSIPTSPASRAARVRKAPRGGMSCTKGLKRRSISVNVADKNIPTFPALQAVRVLKVPPDDMSHTKDRKNRNMSASTAGRNIPTFPALRVVRVRKAPRGGMRRPDKLTLPRHFDSGAKPKPHVTKLSIMR